jgi:hypothetical protein
MDARARAFIDNIVRINQRYGMGDDLPEATYERVVQDSARVFAPLAACTAHEQR